MIYFDANHSSFSLPHRHQRITDRTESRITDGACTQGLISTSNKKYSSYSVLGLVWKSAQKRIFYLITAAFYAFELYCSFHACWALSWAKLMTHVVKNQIKCILPNERLHHSSLVPITWPNLPCLPDRAWRVSLLFTLFRDEKTHTAFRITYD